MKGKISNDSPYKCVYCHEWSRSPVIRSGIDQDLSEAKTSHRMLFRKCPIIKKQINIDSKSCKYFNPASSFYCDKNQFFITFIECLNRRRNQKGFTIFEQCKKCRQFDRDIKLIINDYWFEGKQVIKSRREIKRREKIKTVSKKRTIKRRDKKIKRSIKRRNKKTEGKRIIKRR